MSWEFAPSFDAAHRAALESGKPLVYVCPPAGWALAPLLTRLPSLDGPDPDTLVLVADPADVSDIADAAGRIGPRSPAHGLGGLARARRLLAAGAVRTLVCTPADAVALARQSALALSTVRRVIVGWPEQSLATDPAGPLDTVLAESRDAQRLIVTTDERLPALSGFLTHLAHRAPVVQAARLPAAPLGGTVRWLTVDDARRGAAALAVLDALHPASALRWDPVPGRFAGRDPLAADPALREFGETDEQADLALALDLPSTEILAALLAGAREVAVLVRSSQVGYLLRLAAKARPVRVAGEADRALDRALTIRRRLRGRLADGGLDAELLTLAPLFDEFDPALVAAAALAVGTAPDPPTQVTGWARIVVTAGRKDGIRAGDLVGALANEVGLARTAIGRIELRDAFTLIEIRADDAEQAVRGLTGTTLRGRRVSARLDRR